MTVAPAQVVLNGQTYTLDTWSAWIRVGAHAGRVCCYRWQLWVGQFGEIPDAVGCRYEVREADEHPGGGCMALRAGDPDPAALCRQLALKHWPGVSFVDVPVQLGMGL